MSDESKESPKGFTFIPELSSRAFELTPEEKEKLRQLLEWQRQSERCNMTFGPSIICVNCRCGNNPNNTHCWQCGEATRTPTKERSKEQ